jgi:hypothetical protein
MGRDLKHALEWHNWEVGTFSSYSGGYEFNPRLTDLLSSLLLSCFFQSLQVKTAKYLNLRHDHFHPYIPNSLCTDHKITWSYVLWTACRDLKWNFTLEQAMKVQRGSRGIALLSALDWGGWSIPRPGRFTPGKETRCPLYRRLGGLQSRSRQVRKISDMIPGPYSP